jgi:hypothetical protein
MLNDCCKYAAAINAKGQPFPTELLFMALLLSQNKVSYRSRELVSKHNSFDKEAKQSKQEEEQDLGRENKHDYIRKNERIHYIDD